MPKWKWDWGWSAVIPSEITVNDRAMARSLTVISLLFQSTTHCRYRVYTKFLLTYIAIYRRNRKVLPLGITALQPQSHFHLGTPYITILYVHAFCCVISVCCGRVIFLDFGEAFIHLHDERVLIYEYEHYKNTHTVIWSSVTTIQGSSLWWSRKPCMCTTHCQKTGPPH